MSEPTAGSSAGGEETGDVIRIFGIDDSDGDRTDRSMFRNRAELRYGRAEIPIEVFRHRVESFVTAMGDVIGNLAAAAGEYQLDQVQVTVEVSAKGRVSLLGTGAELAGKGGLTFTFKKPPH
jgi:hypothetical protein